MSTHGIANKNLYAFIATPFCPELHQFILFTMFWDTDQFSWLHQIVFRKILECFDKKRVPVQQVCFDASSTNVSYFVRDW